MTIYPSFVHAKLGPRGSYSGAHTLKQAKMSSSYIKKRKQGGFSLSLLALVVSRGERNGS